MDQLSQVPAMALLIGVLAGGIRLATPYLFAAIGEMFGQMSGVLNLGVEGIMLISGFAAFYTVVVTGSLGLGVLVAALVGLAMGLFTALISVTLKAQQGISGIGIYLFGLGFSDLLFHMLLGNQVQNVRGFPVLPIPLLSQIPVLGPILFSHNLLTYIAFALVPLAWVIVNKTTIGVQIRAAGHNPAAVDSLGLSVSRIRYFTVSLGGLMAGIAGASLSIALLNIFQSNLTSGLGFIAVALVYFGGWRPVGIMLGSLLFSTVNALQYWVQALSLPVPPYLAVALPYVLTIVALVLANQRAIQTPAALTKPFTRGA